MFLRLLWCFSSSELDLLSTSGSRGTLDVLFVQTIQSEQLGSQFFSYSLLYTSTCTVTLTPASLESLLEAKIQLTLSSCKNKLTLQERTCTAGSAARLSADLEAQQASVGALTSRRHTRGIWSQISMLSLPTESEATSKQYFETVGFWKFVLTSFDSCSIQRPAARRQSRTCGGHALHQFQLDSDRFATSHDEIPRISSQWRVVPRKISPSIGLGSA
jgi:hypothetical protein